MYFSIDYVNKIIFGWSPKCGCTHIRTIFQFLISNQLEGNQQKGPIFPPLPDDIENYTILVFFRNPYERLISGFLDKYQKNGEFRDSKWNNSFLSFSQFVDELIKSNWSKIDYHHFEKQTSVYFDKKILLSKNIKIYDMCNIDYEYIEQLYNIKIPDNVIKRTFGHERKRRVDINKNWSDKYVYDLNMDEYIDYNVDIKYFYNEEIKEKVFNFFINDFNFCSENGINYLTL
jgi:hypothetical protein